MKKIALLFFVVVCGGFVAGCGLNSAFKDEPEYTSHEGVLVEQKSNDEYLGTHLLNMDEGEVLALRSLSINLSSSHYLGNLVEVTGMLNEDVFEVTGVSVKEVLLSDEEKAKFAEYKRSDYGYQLKYYSDWEKVETSDVAVEFVSPLGEASSGTSDTVSIQRYLFDDNLDELTAENLEYEAINYLEYYVTDKYPELKSLDGLLRKVGPLNLDSVIIEHSDNQVSYYLYRDDYIFEISFNPGKDAEGKSNYLPENKKIFNEMLSEFKFIGVVDGDMASDDINKKIVADISNLPVIDMELTEFESLPYHFRGKYPKSWYYAGAKGSTKDVLHHYGFSDESIESDNEILSIDIFTGSLPSGENITLGGNKAVKINSGNSSTVYVEVEGQNYRVTGPSSYESLIIIMASSITPVEIEE